ncbi:CaiB/BaiF CoA transferase family protein [Rhodococcus pseudokoreensis]|uniref:CaiB/BaiF CoA transferase family protein n=1 Tax=Rhodococcus pseudokoreensis TaxID=2811421 RepID=UPI001F127D04|nr:CaiB/BaiF CoA-transferase family protein [Rhodococcus pseudokoreensis]
MEAKERILQILDVPSAGTGPLDGILVVDFSRILAGPYCTMLLADLGATVVKIESASGDDTRAFAPPYRGDEATYFLSANRNKHSVVLDLLDPGDLAIAQELAAVADVFVQNFKHGGLEKFELDYESVRRTNPTILYNSITGFGTKQGAHLLGYDLLVQGAAGLMSITGEAEGDPQRVGVAVFDVMTGLHAAIGILAALAHRTASGEGQHVEVNLMMSALSGLTNQTEAYVAGGVVPTRMGNEHPSIFPYSPLPTAEGSLIVVAGNNGQFRSLAKAVQLPELAEDPRFDTPSNRNSNRVELRALLVEALAAHTAEEWFDILTGAGLPCAPINDIGGGVAMAQRLGLDPVVETEHNGRSVPTVRHPIDYSTIAPSYKLPPPQLGASSHLIREWAAQQRSEPIEVAVR